MNVDYFDSDLGANVKELYQPFDIAKEQDDQINRENAKLIFQPKFIPYYPVLQKFDLTDTEILLYGFIDFYTSNTIEGKFYFTNAQLGQILNKNEDTVSKAVGKLNKVGLLTINRKVRANGGQIRFIRLGENKVLDSAFSSSQTRQNIGTNNNKINKNKKTNNKIYLKGKLSKGNATSPSSNYAKFVSLVNNNKHKQRNFSSKDSKGQRQLENLLSAGYNWEDIERVINTAYSEDYHIENDYKYLTPEFLSRSDKFERLLNTDILD